MKALHILKIVLKDTIMSSEKEYINEAIKELEDLQRNIQIITDDERILKEFIFTNCNECINKVDNHFTETCLSCKRYYGCYFEKRESK